MAGVTPATVETRMGMRSIGLRRIAAGAVGLLAVVLVLVFAPWCGARFAAIADPSKLRADAAALAKSHPVGEQIPRDAWPQSIAALKPVAVVPGPDALLITLKGGGIGADPYGYYVGSPAAGSVPWHWRLYETEHRGILLCFWGRTYLQERKLTLATLSDTAGAEGAGRSHRVRSAQGGLEENEVRARASLVWNKYVEEHKDTFSDESEAGLDEFRVAPGSWKHVTRTEEGAWILYTYFPSPRHWLRVGLDLSQADQWQWQCDLGPDYGPDTPPGRGAEPRPDRSD
jgi:hypothetical protein